MKTIGLLGGMSWESTAGYYRAINLGVKQALGGLHSARIVLNSVDFQPIEELQQNGDWDGAARILTDAALAVQAAGADFLLICTNTMHKVAPAIQASIRIPILHIADATAEALHNQGIRKVGLLGTAFTMEQDFYKGRLRDRYGLEVMIPGPGDRQTVHRVIYDELCLGTVNPESRNRYLGIVEELACRGAEGVILGCTEIGLLIGGEKTRIPLFDTTEIHAARAVDLALGREPRP